MINCQVANLLLLGPQWQIYCASTHVLDDTYTHTLEHGVVDVNMYQPACLICAANALASLIYTFSQNRGKDL